jgi:hypothetical protein
VSYGDAAPIAETHQRLDDVNQDNVAHIHMQQNQLNYYRNHVCPTTFASAPVSLPGLTGITSVIGVTP